MPNQNLYSVAALVAEVQFCSHGGQSEINVENGPPPANNKHTCDELRHGIRK